MRKPAGGRLQYRIELGSLVVCDRQQFVVTELFHEVTVKGVPELVIPAHRLAREEKRLKGVREDPNAVAKPRPILVGFEGPRAQHSKVGRLQDGARTRFVPLEEVFEREGL